MPLADAGGRIALLLEGLRDGDLAGRQAVVVHAIVRGRIAHNAMPEWIAAGENRRSRRRAIGHRHVEVGEARSLRRHAVQMRGLERRVAVGGEVAVTEIVGKDEHEVWPIGCLCNVCHKSPDAQK